MIAAVLMVAIHGAVFVEQEYAGPLPFSQPYLDSYDSAGFLICDLDGDGASDILVATEVVFQRDKTFRNRNRQALPDFGVSAVCQPWNQDIYFRTAHRLEIIRWEESGWKRVLSQEVDWPAAGDLDAGNGPDEAGRAAVNRFGAFLHDFDGDRDPEIAVPGPDGVHIFHRNGPFFEPAGVLDIYPPVRLEPQPGVALWPESNRVIQPPYLSRSCSYRFAGNQITVCSQERLSQSKCRFRMNRHTISNHDPFALDSARVAESLSEIVTTRDTAFVCLNDDNDVDLCRFDWRRIYHSSLPMPILEMAVSTNAGKDFTTFQMPASITNPLILDLNGDGRQDLVLQGAGLFDGGLRETVLRATSRRRIDILTHIYLQTDTNTFSDTPSVVHTFEVELDKPPIRQTEMARKILHYGLLNLEGDFDGDDFHDAAVHDRPDRVAVFLGSREGFENKPYAIVPASANSEFYVADFDGDGRSDIVISHGGVDDSSEPLPLRDVLYLLRDSAP